MTNNTDNLRQEASNITKSVLLLFPVLFILSNIGGIAPVVSVVVAGVTSTVFLTAATAFTVLMYLDISMSSFFPSRIR